MHLSFYLFSRFLCTLYFFISP
uniref:Uncharacterized protein n=1 Tax=Arundo donax TaxID=35708 RepID=A0A0A9EDM4_ARUDO